MTMWTILDFLRECGKNAALLTEKMAVYCRKETFMKEIWKDIEGYEGRYKVSNKGRVYDNKLDKFIGYESLGYMCVALCKDKKQKKCRVHRLVAQAFIPNPDNLPVINHKDENKTNNCVENLEWCTVKYNTNYGTSIQRQKETKKRRIGRYNRIY